MYVNVSASHNLVQDLSDMLNKSTPPRVYFALFDAKHQISVLKEALNVLKLPISGVLLDEELLTKRRAEDRDKITKMSKTCGYPVVSLETIKEQENVVIIAKNHPDYFYLIVKFFENRKVNCHLFHYNEIKNSAVVEGKVKVINRMAYLDEWPWFIDILLKDMPQEKKKGFGFDKVVGQVVSNGEYYYYGDMESEYSQFKDGFRLVGGYHSLEDRKKYTVTLLGDSRFANGFLPTEMTIASYLQKRLLKNHLNCEVKNLSVKANRLQNQFAMLKNLNVGASDIVICAISLLGQYEDFQVKSVDTKIRIKVRIMRDMTDYCHARGAEIIFVHLPHIKDIPNLTHIERFIADSYDMKYEPDKSHEKTKYLCMAQNVNIIDFTDIMINTPRTSHFLDYSHFAPDGCKCIADTLCEYIQCLIEKDNLASEELNKLTEQAYAAHKHYVVESRFKGLTAYVKNLEAIAKDKPERCGAIVMNCNPFTLGHRYLIETASAQVEHLYILAVEEDRSVFKFNDRIEMIRRGVADLPNVEVIPSGKFVISSLTFPEYFEKSEKQGEAVDTTTDIEIFCTYIAPALHIKTRFVGEEPLDMVTNQYNMCMKKMLPEYGIDIIEIKRKESGEAPISASRVRKLLAEKNYDEVKTLVPTTTYDYLIQVLGY